MLVRGKADCPEDTPRAPQVPVSHTPCQHVLFMSFGARLIFRCAGRLASQSSWVFSPLSAAKRVDRFV